MKDKSWHSEGREMYGGKWKWRCGEPPCPREHRTLTSPSYVTTQMLPECPYSWILTEVSQNEFWLNHGPVAPVLNLSVLSFPHRCRKFKPVITLSMIFLTTSITERFSGPSWWLVSTPMKDSKFQQFQEAWDVNQVRIKYTNKIVVSSGQGRV